MLGGHVLWACPMGMSHGHILYPGPLVITLVFALLFQLVKEKEYDNLYAHDQLNQSREAKKCFHGYREGRIAFTPTYKYDPGTDAWDSSEKCRAPAWCDRVLWRSFGYYIRYGHRKSLLHITFPYNFSSF